MRTEASSIGRSRRSDVAALSAMALLAAWLIPMGATSSPQRATALPPQSSSNPSPAAVRFSDVTAAAGIDFLHHHGGSGDKQLPETMGSGVVWLDFDRDGAWDIYFVDSDGPNALFRGSESGFEAVSRAGVADRGYGMGVSVADYDADGFPDIYVTNLGVNTLYRNNGDGTFSNVTDEAGVGVAEWSVSSAWGDFDGDALPDLYVANYLAFDLDNPLYCGVPEQNIRSYCHITLFDGVGDAVFRNNGDGAFTDVAERAGFTEAGKGLGVAVGHIDDDDRLDVYVANDTTRNFLLLNRGGFSFEDVGLVSGVGYGADGRPQAGMGTELADLDGDGTAEILVTNFDAEPVNLYRSVAPGFFLDDTFQLGLGAVTFATLGFGLAVEDFDGDGDLDVTIANGHILDDVARVKDNATYPQPNQVLLNRLTELRAGQTVGSAPPDRDLLVEVTEAAGEAMSRSRVSRGMAAADFSGDGAPDLAVTNSNGAAELLRNDSPDPANRMVLRLVGRASDRDAIGARVRVTAAGTDSIQVRPTQVRQVSSASSYASQHAPDLYIGLGASSAAAVEIVWPSGATERLDLVPGQLYVLAEGRGAIARRSLEQR